MNSDASDPARALAWGWILVMLIVCWLPRGQVPREDRLPSTFRVPHFDKWVHGSLFAVYALTWARVAGTKAGRLAAVLAGGVALAGLTEWVQGHPAIGRTTDVADAAADLAGLAVGCGLALAISSLRGGSPTNGP